MSAGTLLQPFRQSVFWRRCRERLYSRSFLRQKEMRTAMDAYAACADRKPLPQMRREMRRMRRFWRCTPHQYYLYECYKRAAVLTADELEAYIPIYYFHNLFIPAMENGRHGMAYDPILSDKCISERLFSALSIPQPETVAKVCRGRFTTPDYEPLDDRDAGALLAASGYTRIFCKAALGGGGAGIRAFDRRPDGSYAAAGGAVLSAGLFGDGHNGGEYLLQGGVVQHPDLAALHPGSANSYRIVTGFAGEHPCIVCAMLRMGRGGSVVDNASRGGIAVHVDGSTGAFGAAARSFQYETFPAHPDTGYTFAGRTAPQWGAVRQVALRAAQKLPQCTFIGWDIAVGTGGPVVLEANFGFSLQLHQMLSGGLKNAFQIGDPDAFWTYRFGENR